MVKLKEIENFFNVNAVLIELADDHLLAFL